LALSLNAIKRYSIWLSKLYYDISSYNAPNFSLFRSRGAKKDESNAK
jgi:hypothetical protein